MYCFLRVKRQTLSRSFLNSVAFDKAPVVVFQAKTGGSMREVPAGCLNNGKLSLTGVQSSMRKTQLDVEPKPASSCKQRGATRLSTKRWARVHVYDIGRGVWQSPTKMPRSKVVCPGQFQPSRSAPHWRHQHIGVRWGCLCPLG